MTLVQSRDDKMLLAVDADEVDEARSLSESLAQDAEALLGVAAEPSPVTVDIGFPNGETRHVPAALTGLLKTVLEGIGRGATITIQSVPREITTTTAAKMLGISRPTLMKLIAENKLPAHKVGSHTRLLASDVSEFREKQREDQRRAFDRLRELDEELGIEP